LEGPPKLRDAADYQPAERTGRRPVLLRA